MQDPYFNNTGDFSIHEEDEELQKYDISLDLIAGHAKNRLFCYQNKLFSLSKPELAELRDLQDMLGRSHLSALEFLVFLFSFTPLYKEKKVIAFLDRPMRQLLGVPDDLEISDPEWDSIDVCKTALTNLPVFHGSHNYGEHSIIQDPKIFTIKEFDY